MLRTVKVNMTTEDLDSVDLTAHTIEGIDLGQVEAKCRYCGAHLFVSDHKLMCLNACYVKPMMQKMRDLLDAVDRDFGG
jgi:exosome complex RNA-binding protein Csl4